MGRGCAGHEEEGCVDHRTAGGWRRRIGALIDGKKGAGIGAAIGGGAGTAAVLTTRGKDVRVGRGAVLTVRLNTPLTINVDER